MARSLGVFAVVDLMTGKQPLCPGQHLTTKDTRGTKVHSKERCFDQVGRGVTPRPGGHAGRVAGEPLVVEGRNLAGEGVLRLDLAAVEHGWQIVGREVAQI